MTDPYELWLNQVSESPSTPGDYYCIIQFFEGWVQDKFGLNVKEFPARWREAKYKGEIAKDRFLDELKDVVRAFFSYLKKHGYTPFSINRRMSVVMSFLHAWEIPIKPLRIRHPYVVFHNRDILKQEICMILEHSTVRNLAIWLMLYESGMRPATLVNLKWKHVKDEFVAHRVPLKISLTSDILKCRVRERWTFIGAEGFEALQKYLTVRFPLKSEDYVFEGEKPKGGKLKSSALSQAFNKLVQKLRLAESRGGKPKEIRLYCLKKAFKKFMLVDPDYKKFWMGRSDTSTHYVSQDVEYHRQLYAEGYETLRLHKTGIDQETTKVVSRAHTLGVLTMGCGAEIQNHLRLKFPT